MREEYPSLWKKEVKIELMGKLARPFFIFRKNEELIGMLGHGHCCQVISGFLELAVDHNIQGLNLACTAVALGGTRASVVLHSLWRISLPPLSFALCVGRSEEAYTFFHLHLRYSVNSTNTSIRRSSYLRRAVHSPEILQQLV